MRKLLSKHLVLSPKAFPFKIRQFKEMVLILVKVLFCREVSEAEFERLTVPEKKLIALTLRKKKLLRSPEPDITFAQIQNLEALGGKRIEENLKFIMNRGLRFLKRSFIELVLKHPPSFPNLRNVDLTDPDVQQRAFYSYYFEESARLTGLNLQRFFRPKYSATTSKGTRDLKKGWLMPKTISKLYFKSLLISPLFVKDFRFFLETELIAEIKWDILKKVTRMCKQWNDFLKKGKMISLLEKVEKNFESNPKCKLAWSVEEVRIAIDQTLAQLPK